MINRAVKGELSNDELIKTATLLRGVRFPLTDVMKIVIRQRHDSPIQTAFYAHHERQRRALNEGSIIINLPRKHFNFFVTYCL